MSIIANTMLQAIDETFSAPNTWIRHQMAGDNAGRVVHVIAPTAVQFSLCGALFRAITALDPLPEREVLHEVINEVEWRLIVAIEQVTGEDSGMRTLDPSPSLPVMTAWLNGWNDDQAANQDQVASAVRYAVSNS